MRSGTEGTGAADPELNSTKLLEPVPMPATTIPAPSRIRDRFRVPSERYPMIRKSTPAINAVIARTPDEIRFPVDPGKAGSSINTEKIAIPTNATP